MKLFYAYLCICLLLAGLLLWRTVFDTAGLPPRLMSDMTARSTPAAAGMLPGLVPFVPAEEPAPDAAALFAVHCAHCHGADGSGRSYTAAQPGMPDVSDRRSNPSPAAQKRRSLAEGRGAMPAFGQRLSAASLDALHQHILKLNPHTSP